MRRVLELVGPIILGVCSMHAEYADVNGLKMYYEVHGTGDPLILIHGGVVGISMFGGNVETLAKKQKVIAIELQGHAHTADIDRPFSFEAFADDIALLVKQLGLPRVDVVGYSMGGGVALQVAIRHPEIVRKLVVAGAGYSNTAMYPEVRAQFAHMGPGAGEMMKQSPLSKMFPQVEWVVLFTKLGKLMSTDYDWSKSVAAMKMPTMLVFADADAVMPEHMVAFYKLLGGGQRDAGLSGTQRSLNRLAVLPGETHYSMPVSPALADTVGAYLAGK